MGNLQSSERIPALDLLRWLAANAILMWHYQHFFYAEPGRLLSGHLKSSQPLYPALSLFYDHGYLAVQIFWVISGVALTVRYGNSSINAAEFARYRIARLLPLYYFFLILIISIQIIEHYSGVNPRIYRHGSASEIVWSLGLVTNNQTLLAPAWSLTLEIVFLPIFLFLVRLRIKPRLIFNALLLIILLSFNQFIELSDGIIVFSELFSCGAFFFTGTLIANISQFNKKIFWNEILLLLSIFGLILQQVSFFIVIVVIFSTKIKLRHSHKRKFGPTTLGNLTYSIFLLHVPLQIMIIHASDRYEIDRLSLFQSPTVLIAYLFLTNIFGSFVYKHVERPMRELITR